MKHKFLTILLTLIAVLCLTLGLAACGGIGGSGQTGSPHTHSFTDYVYNDDATCTEDGTETATCSCGATDTRIKKGTAGHKFTVENACSVCGDEWEFTDGLIYELDQETDTYTVARNADAAGDIVIPYGYQGKWVTSIGWDAFWNCSSLTSIEIPNSVIRIESEAFRDCHSLENIEIPDSVTSIGGLAFYDTAYYNNPSHWDEGVALYMCNRLIEVNNTIEGSYTIRTDTIRIETGAFYRCGGLTSVQIPESVTSIGYQAFGGCISLNSIVIPDSVTSIEATAFVFCEKLTNIEIPDSVISIGGGAFENCSSLTNVKFGDNSNLTSIGNSAFRYCSSLISIEIPDSVTSIGISAFENCSSLESIEVVQGNSVYHSSGNCLIETESKILIAGCKTSQIPDDGSVTSIGSYAFESCSGLTSITIPNGVTSIGISAFEKCSSLESIEMPDSVTSIGYKAFIYCSSLINVKFGDNSNLTSIESYAFENCNSLENIEIPDSVTSIGWGAFSGCSRLTSITIPNGVTLIGISAFEDCNSLEIVEIPDSVTSIGDYAFWACSSLTDIQFKGTVEEWEAIQKGESWDSSTGNYAVACTDGTVDKEGNVTYFKQ